MLILGRTSRFLNRLIDSIVGIVLILIILFSSYSLYSSYLMFNGAFLSNELKSMKPTGSSATDQITFEGIKGINSDVKAWLTIDNTNIDYPVVQGKTNLEYVNKNVYGDFAFEGSIFLDSRNKGDFSDRYSLLYGHHMENGSMFGDLERFLQKDFFDNNKKGSLITEAEEFEIEFFAVIRADGYDQRVFNPLVVSNEQNQIEFLNHIKDNSEFSRQIQIDENDKIIGISTCTTVQTNGRTILFGVLRSK